MNLFNSTSSPSTQQQQQQYQSPINDFTNDLFGESSPQQAKQTTTTTPQSKDPFADLF